MEITFDELQSIVKMAVANAILGRNQVLNEQEEMLKKDLARALRKNISMRPFLCKEKNCKNRICFKSGEEYGDY